MISVFERPLLPGWIYPCSVDNIRQRLSSLPSEHLRGLEAVGLVPATRKDCGANGRYFWASKPTIHLYSFRESLSFKLPAHTKMHHIERGLLIERQYGMQAQQEGGRFLCRWERECLRRFILDHVLLHEIGHHLYHCQRRQQGYPYRPRTREAEQFAEAYALRMHHQTPVSD